MSRRIGDASAKLARSFYPRPRMTDNVLSTSLGQLTGFLERSATPSGSTAKGVPCVV